MIKQETKIINGKQYYYRNSLPQKIAGKVACELIGRGCSIKLIKEKDDAVGGKWVGIWFTLEAH